MGGLCGEDSSILGKLEISAFRVQAKRKTDGTSSTARELISCTSTFISSRDERKLAKEDQKLSLL